VAVTCFTTPLTPTPTTPYYPAPCPTRATPLVGQEKEEEDTSAHAPAHTARRTVCAYCARQQASTVASRFCRGTTIPVLCQFLPSILLPPL